MVFQVLKIRVILYNWTTDDGMKTVFFKFERAKNTPGWLQDDTLGDTNSFFKIIYWPFSYWRWPNGCNRSGNKIVFCKTTLKKNKLNNTTLDILAINAILKSMEKNQEYAFWTFENEIYFVEPIVFSLKIF